VPVRVVGAVLTGGASKRMGQEKALIEVDNVPLARRVANALLAGGVERVVLVGGHEGVAAELWLEGVVDRWSAIGPLGGITTALLDVAPFPTAGGPPSVDLDEQLQAASPLSAGRLGIAAPERDPLHDTFVVVAPCDQPHLGASLIASMIAALRSAPDHIVVAAPRTPDGRRHPLPTVWRASQGPVLEQLIATGARRADSGIHDGNVVDVPAPERDVRDVDTPGDLEALDDWDRALPDDDRPLRWGEQPAPPLPPVAPAAAAAEVAPAAEAPATAPAPRPAPDGGDGSDLGAPLRWEPPSPG
jgi:molybdopterin-guanine dinucleotide biosynthesis protein A